MVIQDKCANCGKIYGHHTDTGYCFEGQSGRWFPGSVADAIIKTRQTPPEEPEYPTVEYIEKLKQRALNAEAKLTMAKIAIAQARNTFTAHRVHAGVRLMDEALDELSENKETQNERPIKDR